MIEDRTKCQRLEACCCLSEIVGMSVLRRTFLGIRKPAALAYLFSSFKGGRYGASYNRNAFC